ncbi:MAG TPA: DnaA/Hda family protein [Planctomycetaceae bacterium]|jgi:chromosomal replication initiator protein
MPRLDKPALSSTLVSFLVLPENRFAFEAVSAIGEAALGDERPRPIFLYGPSGVGKTHLARHAVRSFLARRPDARVEHITAAEFAAEFAEASSRKTIPLFQAATREFHLFVIEDIQALERREQTQIQLLLLCDELSAAGGQIVWTSRNAPGEMPQFSRKLVTRFRAGVTAQLRPPGVNSRVKLLQHFGQSRQIRMPDDAARLLATELPVSPRELWALLTQLEAIAREQRKPLDSDLVRKFLRQEVTPPKPRLEDVCLAVARQFGISSTQLRSRKQTRGVVFPRQCAMLAARQLTGRSLEQIGKYFGGRDHSTVIYACRRLTKLLPLEAELRLNLSQIEAVLGVPEGSVSAELREGDGASIV